jgi:GNAT superfamily N-acetyltransferase
MRLATPDIRNLRDHFGIQSTLDFYQTIAVDRINFPGLTAIATGVGSPFLNVVIDTQTKNFADRQVMNQVEDFFKSHRAPWSWFVMPGSINALTRLLEENEGFEVIEEVESLYFDLKNSLPMRDKKESLEIKELDKTDDLRGWIEAIQEGFPIEDEKVDPDAYRKLNLNLLKKGESKLRHFVAYEAGELAASATLFLSEDAVMLHNLATKKRFQRHGIARALILHQLNLAKKLGFKYCFLDSSKEGLKLYQDLGFELYSKIKVLSLKSC